MPRDLGDVLDYFLPAARSGGNGDGRPGRLRAPGASASTRVREASRRTPRQAALPVVAVPIGDRDVVRAALAWNLVVEMARLGASATLVAPADPEPSLLWPEPGPGPVGAEIVLAQADRLSDLNRAALDVAVIGAARGREGGLVLVRVPPRWLLDPSDARSLLRWALLFATPDARDLSETYGVAKRLFAANPEVQVGLTIHGARRVSEARGAFERIASVADRHAGLALRSYGLLVDDLHVYRAIVARLLVEDARKHTVV